MTRWLIGIALTLVLALSAVAAPAVSTPTIVAGNLGGSGDGGM